MTKKLVLPKSKKNHMRRHLLPLSIAGLVVIIGLGTLTYEISKDFDSTRCPNGICEKLIKVDISTKTASNTNTQLIVNQSQPDTTDRQRMSDIELENNRLLLQRDIQRAINLTSPKKPFNYDESDFCTLTLTNDRSTLKTTQCTNQVYKRILDLALEKANIRDIVKRYDFLNFTPTIEARLKF